MSAKGWWNKQCEWEGCKVWFVTDNDKRKFCDKHRRDLLMLKVYRMATTRLAAKGVK